MAGSPPIYSSRHELNSLAVAFEDSLYGEIASALFHAREAGVPCERDELALQQALTEHLANIWKEPGSGMWEERDQPERFTYSGVMAWLTLDRARRRVR